MKSDDITFLKRKILDLEQTSKEFEKNVEALHNNQVNTAQSDTLREEQQELQDEMEQLVSDMLAVLDDSDYVGDYELPNQKRVPVGEGRLPHPSNRDRSDESGPPPWAKGNGGNGNGGNGNGGNGNGGNGNGGNGNN